MIHPYVPKTLSEACDHLFGTLAKPPSHRWPRFLGGIRAPRTLAEGQWTRVTDDSTNGVCKGLLFEYMPDLVPLTPQMVDDVLAADIVQILRDLHVLNIVHWDHVDHSAWPQIGFGNIFVRYNHETQRKGTVF